MWRIACAAVLLALLIAMPTPPAAAEPEAEPVPGPEQSPAVDPTPSVGTSAPEMPAPAPAPPDLEPVAPRAEAPAPAAGQLAQAEPATPVGVVVAESYTVTSVERTFSDGLSMLELYTSPEFFEEPGGSWRRLDPTLRIAGRDATELTPVAAPATVRIERQLAGPTVTVGSGARDAVRVSHPGARGSAAVEGSSAVYGDALGSGRDLRVEATADGFKDSLVVRRRGGSGTWRVGFDLPAGARARQADAAVEMVASDGSLLGTYGDGVAFDAAGGQSAVSVTLLDQEGEVATVEVAASAVWMRDPQRRYPVTVDPAYSTNLLLGAHTSSSCEGSGSTGSYGHCDTYTYSNLAGTMNGSSYPSSAHVKAGRSSSYQYESFLKFATDNWGSYRYNVKSATLSLHTDSPGASETFKVYENTRSPSSTFTWSTRPGRGTYQGSRYVTAAGRTPST